MKKLLGNLFALIGCFGFLFIVSCSDKDEEVEEAPAPKLGIYLPVGSTTWDPSIKEVTDSTMHAYDKNGRLIQFFNYKRYSTPIAWTIEYDNLSRISKIKVTNSWTLQEREYNEQGQLFKIYFHNDQQDPAYTSLEQTLKYDASGRLIELYSIGYDKVFGNPPLHTINKFAYNSDDLIAIDSSFFAAASTTNGKDSFTEKFEYEYDNMKGVNEFGLDLRGGLLSRTYFFAPLKHNITSIKVTSKGSSASEVNFLYEYHSSGYPAKITSSYNGRLGESRKITFGYF